MNIHYNMLNDLQIISGERTSNSYIIDIHLFELLRAFLQFAKTNITLTILAISLTTEFILRTINETLVKNF